MFCQTVLRDGEHDRVRDGKHGGMRDAERDGCAGLSKVSFNLIHFKIY